MFSKTYIEKCIKFKVGIHHMVTAARGWTDTRGVPLEMFRADDYFHHAKTMEEGTYKQAKEVKDHSCLYADDPIVQYPVEDCVLLPTEELLRAGLLAIHWSVGDQARGKGHEHLLDEIIKSGKLGD